MSTSCLENDQFRRAFHQRPNQFLNSCIVIIDAQHFACRPNCNVKAPLRRVDTNPDCTHSPSLWNVDSALHSRLPDTGSSGPGIHSSCEGSICGAPEAKHDLRDLLIPDLPQIEYTSL